MPLNRTLRQFFRNTKPVWELGLGAVLAVLLAVAAIYLQWIATHITGPPLRIIIILAASSGLYLVRYCSRLAYGFLEILVGLFVIMGTMSRNPELVDPGLLLVQLAAGMYVIIRGFDNFAQSAPRRRGRTVQGTLEFDENVLGAKEGLDDVTHVTPCCLASTRRDQAADRGESATGASRLSVSSAVSCACTLRRSASLAPRR
jgi:hypothetical protein